MALPSITELSTWVGNKFTNTTHDSNLTKLVQFIASGTWDLNINNLTCNDITANSIDVQITNGVMTGSLHEFSQTYAPAGYLRSNGANHAIASYLPLFKVLGHTYGPGDGTPVAASGVSVAGNVCTISATGHLLSNGDYVSVLFTDIASAVVIDRGVVIENISANTFDFSVAGWAEQPVAPLTFTAATTFPVPDTRGMVLRDIDTTATIDPDAAARTNRGDGTTGAQVGTKQQDMYGSHRHEIMAQDGASHTSPYYVLEYSVTNSMSAYSPQEIETGGNTGVQLAGGLQTNTINIGVTVYIKT